MNKIMKYAVTKFEEQFHVDTICSPVYKLKGCMKELEDVIFHYNSFDGTCIARVSYFVINGYDEFKFNGHTNTWDFFADVTGDCSDEETQATKDELYEEEYSLNFI